MTNALRKLAILIVAGFLPLLAGCAAEAANMEAQVKPLESVVGQNADLARDTVRAAATPTTEPSPTPSAEPALDYQEVKPNEVGDIMIIMYHGLEKGENIPKYACTEAEFLKNLEDMYEMGFRLTSLADVANNNITLEAGYSPLVLTFDDGLSTAFSLEEKDGVLVPRKGCAVDVINTFAEKHPDFGRTAAFFVNAYAEPFKGSGTLDERLRYLIDNGYEVGNHTYDHAHLKKLDATGIQKQLGMLDQVLRKHVPDYTPGFIAYPYGERPAEALRHFMLRGEYDGKPYQYKWALREGQSGASAAPNHVKFDVLNIPRVRGTDSEATDLGWQLRAYRENPGQRYISDGNPDRISVPVKLADSVHKGSLLDKELYLYDEEGNKAD